MKKIWILTLFPEYFTPFFEKGVSSRIKNYCEIHIISLRDYGLGLHKSVDDHPYGKGEGTLLRIDVLDKAILDIIKKANASLADFTMICPTARGKVFNTVTAKEISQKLITETDKNILFLCGRYEGFDQRLFDLYSISEINVGDFVLTGGELPVMTILDASLRFIPGLLGNNKSSQQDSFEEGLLEQPQYTRPANYKGLEVPAILLSGHTKNIEDYQREERKRVTQVLRPDLLKKKVKE
ncbi:MAG: tRNA (guanosine(37)-N1)-methyltransferase TrmD [Bacteriovoracaceae bacterium]|nr:tRNA (guanosine(37)-N1)-methyltransferase TrmD [Bacteriovoracaceae bacterium]